MTELASFLIDAFGSAARVALMAMGFALVFRVTGHIHFAYAGIWTLASYVFASRLDAGDPVLLCFLWAALVSAVLSVLCLLAYRRLKDEYSIVLGSFGIFLALLGVQLILWGPTLLGVGDNPVSGAWIWTVAGLRLIVPVVHVAHGLSAAVIAILLMWILGATRIGGQAVAVAENRQLAMITGIEARRIEVMVYVASGILAAISASIQVLSVGTDVFTGTEIFTEALIVVILAGPVIVAAVIACLLFGAAHSASQLLLGTELVTLATYGILLALLVWKPAGMFRRDLLWSSRGSAMPEIASLLAADTAHARPQGAGEAGKP